MRNLSNPGVRLSRVVCLIFCLVSESTPNERGHHRPGSRQSLQIAWSAESKRNHMFLECYIVRHV